MKKHDPQVGGPLTPEELDAWWGAYDLGARSRGVLRWHGIRTPAEVRRIGKAAFLRFENCGKVTVNEIGRAIGGWSRDDGDPRPPGASPKMGMRVWMEAVVIKTDYTNQSGKPLLVIESTSGRRHYVAASDLRMVPPPLPGMRA